MSDLYAEALAEVRALRTDPQADTAPRSPEGCCTGDRRGYQKHQRNRTPACDTSKAANADYSREYLPGWRARKSGAADA